MMPVPRVSVRNSLRISEQAARRNLVQQAHEPLPGILHLDHFRLARAELLDHGAEVFLRHVDGEFFVRLELLAVLSGAS